MSTGGSDTRIYWHRDLPPPDAEPLGEYQVEATSGHVPGTFRHGDEQWTACYDDLMTHASARLADEIRRLGGTCAHVLSEHIEARRNEAVGDAWLYGRFTYVLFREAGRQIVGRAGG